jgi:hypothetical protein
MKISKELATLMYNSAEPSIKKFALDNYPELGLNFPKNWVDIEEKEGYFIDTMSNIIFSTFTSWPHHNKNVFTTANQCNAILALAQLSQAMKVYRGDWLPNWDDARQDKWCITMMYKHIHLNIHHNEYHILSFQSKDIAKLFATNFKELILKTKLF